MRLPVTLRPRFPTHALPSRRVRAMTLRADGLLDVERDDGALSGVGIHPHTTVLPGLVVLLYRRGGGIESALLPRFALAGDGHRQLRLWLRWKAITA